MVPPQCHVFVIYQLGTSTHHPRWLLKSSHRVYIPDTQKREEKDISCIGHTTLFTPHPSGSLPSCQRDWNTYSLCRLIPLGTAVTWEGTVDIRRPPKTCRNNGRLKYPPSILHPAPRPHQCYSEHPHLHTSLELPSAWPLSSEVGSGSCGAGTQIVQLLPPRALLCS